MEPSKYFYLCKNVGEEETNLRHEFKLFFSLHHIKFGVYLML